MNRRILTIAVAVLLALLGTVAVLFYVSKADARAIEGQKAVSVLVASKAIPAGTTARDAEALFSRESMPAASVPSDVVREITTDLKDRVTSTDIAPGQLLTRRMLVSKSQQDDIVLPLGKLAVTIPVEAGRQGEETLKPGFKVAVFDTFTVRKGESSHTPNGERIAFREDNNHATRLLLAKVEVVGVVAEKSKTKNSSSSFGKYLVTVAVTQEEAEKLIHAINTGTVSLAQVNDDSKLTPSAGVDNYRLFKHGD